MSAIIYDARRIKAYERLQELGKYVNKTADYIESLWKELVYDGELMAEFTYYLDNETLKDEVRCEGYGLTDLYMYQMRRYNVYQDYGKNDSSCSKEALVLDALYMMANMKREPDKYVKLLENDFGLGMDRL